LAELELVLGSLQVRSQPVRTDMVQGMVTATARGIMGIHATPMVMVITAVVRAITITTVTTDSEMPGQTPGFFFV
jgi:predicted membrane protein